MTFRADCSSRKTAVAAMINVPIPTAVAKIPDPVPLALLSMAWFFGIDDRIRAGSTQFDRPKTGIPIVQSIRLTPDEQPLPVAHSPLAVGQTVGQKAVMAKHLSGRVRGSWPRSSSRQKVTLRGTRPPVWRRILILGTMTLGDLHQATPDPVGWEVCHLRAFNIDSRRYGDRSAVGDIRRSRPEDFRWAPRV
jgi:hypothetical protein